MAWLLAPLRSLWAALTAAPGPLRVGVLTTGELVLVDGQGGAQVFSAPVTEAIQDALEGYADAQLSRQIGPAMSDRFDAKVDAIMRDGSGRAP